MCVKKKKKNKTIPNNDTREKNKIRYADKTTIHSALAREGGGEAVGEGVTESGTGVGVEAISGGWAAPLLAQCPF